MKNEHKYGKKYETKTPISLIINAVFNAGSDIGSLPDGEYS